MTHRPPRASTMAAVGILSLAAMATPALGQNYVLNMSAPATTAAGETILINAAGANPPTDFFTSWLDVYAIPASVLTTCPAGYLNASQVASSTHARGGTHIAVAQREDVDEAGRFSMSVAYTPTTVGPFLICGYTNDGATGTLARASLMVTVQQASTGGGGGGGGQPGAEPRKGKITLSATQLLINQRIGQAAIRRLNALEARLEGRPAPAPATGGKRGRVTLSAAQLLINQRIYQAGVRRANALEARLEGRTPPAPKARGGSGTVRLTVAQLAINQRIAQAAVRRANALNQRIA